MAKAREVIDRGQKDAFFIYNPESIVERVRLWRELLPEVELFYAVKSNSDEIIVQKMLSLGCKFDCASKAEIEKVLQLGGSPSDIIFANPVKKNEHIQYAKEKGVNIMTFDCSEEAIKMKSENADAEALLRIAVEATDAPCPMTQKFGASQAMYESILDTCVKIGLRVRGVSFHVGSGGCSFSAYHDSILNAKKVFEIAKQKGMQDFDILDIGGGFSMSAETEECNFDKVAPKIMNFLRKHFPKDKKVKFIAEPGRYICQDALSVAMRIILARKNDENILHYFVDSGVYQALGCQTYDQEYFKGHPIVTQSELDKRIDQEQTSFIWGQTCDGVDWLTKNRLLPRMHEGEWLLYRNVGAYNKEVCCRFNGFELHKVFCIAGKTGNGQ